MNDLEICLEVV